MSDKLINKNTPRLWDRLLFEIDETMMGSPYYLDKIRKVIRFLRNKRGNFLDVGFGMGNLEKNIILNNFPLNIYGIDFSNKAVNRANKLFKGKYLVGSAQKLPFKSSFFDAIAMLDVYEHISKGDSKDVMDEINRVTKIGGSFVISVPVNEDLRKMNEEGTNYNMHVRQLTSRTLKKELQRSGFKVLKEDYLYAFRKYYFLKKIVANTIPGIRKPNVLIVYCTRYR